MFHFDLVFGRQVLNLLVFSLKFGSMLEISAKPVAFWKLERISRCMFSLNSWKACCFWELKGISRGLFSDMIWKFGELRLIAGNAEFCCLPY